MNTKTEELLQCIRDLQTSQGSLRSSVEGSDTSCLYATALTLGALCEIDGAAALCDDLVLHLLQVMDGSWTLPHEEGDGCSARLDVTCCALEAMTRYRRSILTPEAMVKIVHALTETEVAEGGPYRSRFRREGENEGWDRIDPVGNAFTAALLAHHDIRSEALDAYLQGSLADGSISPFVSSLPASMYAYARLGLPSAFMRTRIGALIAEQRADGSWGNPLQTACAVTVLLPVQGVSTAVRRGVRYLEALSVEEMCQPYAFDDEGGGGAHCASGALTAACALEALQRYEEAQAPAGHKDSHQAHEEEHENEHNVYLLVRALINNRIQSLPPDVRTSAQMHLSALLDTDHSGEIAMLPYRFYEGLAPSCRRFSEQEIARLCLANVYGWMAYRIYDDVLDGEGGAQALSVANICLRSVSDIYQRLGGHAYRQFVHVMDRIDAANAWELRTCRTAVSGEGILIPSSLPNDAEGRSLVERSLGHALGPLTILYQLGYAPTSNEVRALRAFFWHYISAKQLCDDVEDWESDLKNGQLNYVGRAVLRSLKSRHPSLQIDEEVYRVFWVNVLPGIATRIEGHVSKAHIALERLRHVVADRSALERVIQRYADTAVALRIQQQERIALLQAYGEGGTS